ncbi:MAG: hypothetical protein QOI38_2418 [Sphingomonadales bacterium]|jgi:hypothetical protein|nr:hypothetical protein [Sphingomonadales bacterium]
MRAVAAIVGLGILAAPAATFAQEGSADTVAREQRRIERWSRPTLTRFRSEAEFRRYLRDVYGEPRAEPVMPSPVIVAPSPPPPGAAPSPASPPNAVRESVQRVSANNAGPGFPGGAANPQITNVQEQGVDEGDIVKQVGRFLLVLQDGRIFSIDTGADGGGGLALADRFNVYRSAEDDGWYDEMLVFGDRVVITAYSYDQEASQISVLRVGEDGRLRDEGTFLISSNDYYDDDNYATRLSGDRLVVYTPYDVEDVASDDEWRWPSVRRWRREEGRAPPRRGRPIMDARSIYRPVATYDYPVIHTVSICPLGEALTRGNDLECETRAFVGPEDAEMYVTPREVWLWASGQTAGEDSAQRCVGQGAAAPTDANPALLYRMPLFGDGLEVAGVRGLPIDQLSMAAIGDNFHALSRLESFCRHRRSSLSFVTVPRAGLGRRLRHVGDGAYVPVPEVQGTIENRFTDRYLVYGGRGYGSFPPETPLAEPSPLAIVPVADPAAARLIPVPHNILRAERVGDDVVVTGYRDRSGLQLSLVDLGGTPAVASTVRLDGRYETEGRSHAFNSMLGADGAGLIGIPTAPRAGEAGRFVWRSGASDISYVSLDPAGGLAPLGELTRSEGPRRTDYRCEVSCVDWYGNSRPIFTGGRVFALVGTELIEGRVEEGRVREVGRLDLTAPPSQR